MEEKAKKVLLSIVIILGFIASFLTFNFDNTLGLAYFIFIGVIAFVVIWDKKIDIPWAKEGKSGWIPILVAVIAFAIFTIISIFLLKIFSIQDLTASSIFTLIGSTLPALAGSQVMTFFSYGIFIPFVETIAFIAVFEFFSQNFLKVKQFSFKNVGVIISMVVFSVLFALFHLSAKGITNYLALGVVALMMLTTLIIAVFQKEMRAAVYFHILLNSIALAARFGLINLAIF